MIIGMVTEVAIFYFSEQQDLILSQERSMSLVNAGVNRMRPIAMTTIAAILTRCCLVFVCDRSGFGNAAAVGDCHHLRFDRSVAAGIDRYAGDLSSDAQQGRHSITLSAAFIGIAKLLILAPCINRASDLFVSDKRAFLALDWFNVDAYLLRLRQGSNRRQIRSKK